MSKQPEALRLADRSPAMRGGTWADDACDELRRLHAFGEQVNAIRNSIIGLQMINWSEHIYPLVAALDEAGFVGLEYDTARANVGTLIERANKAEAENKQLQASLDVLADAWNKRNAKEAASDLPAERERLRAAVAAAVAQERAAWETALKQAWRMVDPLKPAGSPGSYARGQDAGIVAALRTVTDNLAAIRATPTEPKP